MTTLVLLAILVLGGVGISAMAKRFACRWYDPYERQQAFLERGSQWQNMLLPAP